MSDLPLVELFVASELGNSSFLVADPETGDAVVIDPLRDVDQYLSRAERSNFTIRSSFETHVHNDFVSGSREIEREAGARILASAEAALEFAYEGLRHEQQVRVGRFCVTARHTPGHTANHLSYVLSDTAGRPIALFSGGALMVGGTARTDLFGPHLAAPLAVESFRTLHERLADLPDDVAVYPTHGAGSFCGSATSDKRATSMGDERMTNPLLASRELLPFLARVLVERPYPTYYRDMAALNRRGAALVGRHVPPLRSLDAREVKAHADAGAALLDLRLPAEYDREHIPGSYNFGNEEAFSAWIGWILPATRPLVLVGGDERRYRECRLQLFRIGYDNILGTMSGGMDAWREAGHDVTSFKTGDIDDLATWLTSGEAVTVLDVRDEDEWASGHVPGAVHVPVAELEHEAADLPHDSAFVVHCAAGYRAGIAASILERSGLSRIMRIEGGFPDWEARSLPVVVPGRPPGE